MSLLHYEKSIIDNEKKKLNDGERLTIRRQQCRKCWHVLALEITKNMGFGGEYYVADGAIWLADEPHILYKNERWFGNYIKCPVCGSEGNLPIDKPLNWEGMQYTREVQNA